MGLHFAPLQASVFPFGHIGVFEMIVLIVVIESILRAFKMTLQYTDRWQTQRNAARRDIVPEPVSAAQPLSRQEEASLDQMHAALAKMEQRIANLETILTSREREREPERPY